MFLLWEYCWGEIPSCPMVRTPAHPGRWGQILALVRELRSWKLCGAVTQKIFFEDNYFSPKSTVSSVCTPWRDISLCFGIRNYWAYTEKLVFSYLNFLHLFAQWFKYQIVFSSQHAFSITTLSLSFSCLVVSNCLWPHYCSMPGLHVPHHFLKFVHINVHRISDANQPSHPLIPSSPSALNLFQHQGLFQWVSCSHQMTKILELQLQHQSFQWVFRVDFPYFLTRIIPLF